MARPEPALTREQLLLAFNRLHRPGWPASLDEALAHPLRGPAVLGLARCLVREAARRPAPVRPTRPPAMVLRATGGQPRFDARRAAANDLKDD